MTTRRLLLLLLAIVGTCSLVFALPKQRGYQPVGIALGLPEYLGLWWGRDAAVTERERQTLGFDTDFARKVYVDTSTGSAVLVSIVLSGQDMMTGIHRPERCLLAQGWNPGASSQATLEVPGFGPLRMTRLRNYRKDTIPVAAGKGRTVSRENLCYYWFVGYKSLAATHEERVSIDLRDRVLEGYNQRWAMVMIAAEITKPNKVFGMDERQTGAMLESFIKQLAPEIIGPSIKRQTARGNPRSDG